MAAAAPSLLSRGGVAALAWAAVSAAVFWLAVGSLFALRDARTPVLAVAWLGAFLQLDIALRYGGAWPLLAGAILLAYAATGLRARVHEAWVALALALLPLVAGRLASPAFVALGPACLLLARAGGRWVKALTVLVVLAATVLYTSAWPRAWLTPLTDGFRSKAWGAAALAAAAVGVLVARARPSLDHERLARWRPIVACGALYLGLAVLWSHPLLFHLESALAYDAGDPLFIAWALWWNAHAVPLTQSWWDAPFLHPVGGTLAFSETFLGLAVFTTPLQWLGLSAIAAYNVAFLLSQPLAAGAAHALCYRLSRRHDAALLGGLAFGFAPYRIGHLAHLQLLWCFAMPLCLLGLHGYLETGRRRWLLLFAGAWLLQGLTNGYFFLYLPVLVVLWLVWFARGLPPRSLALVGLAAAAVVLVMAPLLRRYATVHERLGLGRTVGDMQQNSGAVVSWLGASPIAIVSDIGLRTQGSPEAWLYPGLTATGLVVAAWVVARRRGGERPTKSRWPVVAVFGCGLVLGGLAGRWSTALALGAVFAGGALVVSPALRQGWARRSALVFYAGATLVLWMLCLGPGVRVLDTDETLVAGPFALLANVPGFAALRAPARFAMPAAMCLAVAVSLACARLLPVNLRGRVWTAVIALALAFEGWISWLPLAPLPPRSPLLESLGSEATAVLELPMGDHESEYAAMYRATFHRLPLVNGHSGHVPPHYPALLRGLREHDERVLEAVAETGAVAVRLSHGADSGGEWRRLLDASPSARLLRRAGPESVYLLRHLAPATHEAARALPIATIEANTSPERIGLMKDGDPRTRWTTDSPQVGGEEVVVRLTAEAEVRALVLALGPFNDDAPRQLVIDTSRDGVAWQPAWSGAGHAASVRAALREPKRLPARYDLTPRRASYVRLRQLGSDPEMWWSISEIEVLGPSSRPAVASSPAGHQ